MRGMKLLWIAIQTTLWTVDAACQRTPATRSVPAQSMFSVGDVRLRYRVEGRGPAVVLLHGFAGRLENMDRLAAALMPGSRVIRMDLRGFGESDRPHEASRYGLNLANDVIALLDHLGERRADVVGFSLGAAVAAKVAARRPDRVRRLVLLGGGPLTDTSRIVRVGDEAATALEQGRGLRPLFVALAAPGYPAPSDSVMGVISREVLAGGDSLAWAAHFRSQRGLALSDAEARRLAMPTLLIAGTLDPLADEARAWARVLPQGRFVAIRGVTHDDVPTRPEVAREVRAFLLRSRGGR